MREDVIVHGSETGRWGLGKTLMRPRIHPEGTFEANILSATLRSSRLSGDYAMFTLVTPHGCVPLVITNPNKVAKGLLLNPWLRAQKQPVPFWTDMALEEIIDFLSKLKTRPLRIQVYHMRVADRTSLRVILLEQPEDPDAFKKKVSKVQVVDWKDMATEEVQAKEAPETPVKKLVPVEEMVRSKAFQPEPRQTFHWTAFLYGRRGS